MRKIVLLCLALPLVACGGSSSNPSTTSNAKKAGPKNPKMMTSKPPAATSKGMASKVTAPGDDSGKGLMIPGGAQAEVFAWQADVAGNGTLSSCAGAFLSDGSAIIACSPLVDTCDDGSDLEAELLLAYDATQAKGAFAIAGSDLCGEGYDVIACDFDGSGNVGTCGVGNIVDDHIEVSE